MNSNSKIYVAGHNGMVGSAILRCLKKNGFTNLIYFSSSELDLRIRKDVGDFFQSEKPEYVFLAAAKVGGILANSTYPADFIYDNLAIELNVIDAAYHSAAKKLLFLGSSCIYPKNAPQPLKEEYLLSDFLEETNEYYAIAKIAGIKLCEAYRRQYNCNFISAMPTNLYGPNDNYDLQKSHVLPALIRKFHEAKINKSKSVKVWGTGLPRREFLHVDDLAEACLLMMKSYNDLMFMNIGFGEDITIQELAMLVREITAFTGEIEFDKSKPDGTMRKLMDSTKIKNLGWSPKISLREGILQTYLQFERSGTYV